MRLERAPPSNGVLMLPRTPPDKMDSVERHHLMEEPEGMVAREQATALQEEEGGIPMVVPVPARTVADAHSYPEASEESDLWQTEDSEAEEQQILPLVGERLQEEVAIREAEGDTRRATQQKEREAAEDHTIPAICR